MYCKFPHRIPYNKVTHLLVEGDIFLTSISFKNIVLSGKKSPFLGELPVALQPEKIIRVHGITHPNCDRININLATGPNSQPRDDIALHISIRLNQGCIVRNSYANNRWQDEDRSGNLPIEKGQSFKIVVLVDPLHYKIAVNGQPYCTFPHRIPYNRVTHLLVEEDSIQTSVSFDGVALPNKNVVDGQPYCEFLQRTPYTQIIHLFLTSISFKETDFLCNLPILTKIPSGLYPGKMIRFHGILYSYRFDINLTTGRNLKPQDDIALHISIRLNEGCIVMNSYRKNTWEDEERGWELPINKGQSFEVIVFMDASAYWIEINSQFHWKFLHRMPYDQVNYIMVDGNVILDSISFEEIVVLSG
ncbi:hypothetical protein ABEB36_002595 [Hypothenemus hampei]|uniref:Galectin n=1 Tax=Hypothenemus hampei TaxID=57062 RepID=A0ABD1F821_HYPHA